MWTHIIQQSMILNKLEKEGRILIIGGLYDIDSGEVTFYDSIK